MINFQPIHCVYIEFKCTYTVHLCPKEDRKYIPTGMVTWCMISIHAKFNGFLDNVNVSTIQDKGQLCVIKLLDNTASPFSGHWSPDIKQKAKKEPLHKNT